MKNKIFKFFKFITNNEAHPQYEIEFDIVFFIIITLALLIGIYLLYQKQVLEWAAFLIIEYVWALDNMRHNR